MSLDILIGVIELSLIFSIMSFGIYITFKILDFPDLTVDGSFTLGSVVTAMFTINNYPLFGIVMGMIVGVFAGIITSLLHTKLKINYILAGILTMSGLYSVNLRVANNQPNISLFDKQTLFTLTDNLNISRILVLLVINIVIILVLSYFFKTQTGLAIRATGSNEDMVKASSINIDRMKIIGLGIANGLVGLCAAIFTQYQLFYDLSLGIGMMVVGLTGIIIGESILGKKSIFYNLLSIILGVFLYRLLLAFTLSGGMNPNDWKLLSAFLVVVVISMPGLRTLITKRGK